MEFSIEDRRYLLEHFRVQYMAAVRSERPGSEDVAKLWYDVQQLFVQHCKNADRSV